MPSNKVAGDLSNSQKAYHSSDDDESHSNGVELYDKPISPLMPNSPYTTSEYNHNDKMESSTTNLTGQDDNLQEVPLNFPIPQTASAAMTMPQPYLNETKYEERPRRPHYTKNNFSFDAINKFNPSQSKHSHLQFAEGDVPKSKFVRLYYFLLNTSIVTRWAIFILPIAGALFVPGIVSVTSAPNAEVLRVRLLWWSIWLETIWVGWWASWAASKVIPWIAQRTVAIIVPNGKQLIDYFIRCEKYLAAVGWTIACWAVFNFIVLVKFSRDHSDASYSTLSVIAQVHAGIIICAAILASEKILIQLIAYNFHRTSYDDRIKTQKFQLKALATLYSQSRDLGRKDTLDGMGKSRGEKGGLKAGRVFRKAAREAKEAATNATTALGNVASEIAGSSVLQPNSPMSMVTTALGSGNKTRHLARRIYYSFCPPYRSSLVLSDIEHFFPDPATAEDAFAVFDKDFNGDATLEEIEMSCLEIHRERMALSSSMRDLDSAVAALDKILMSIYLVAAVLVMVSMLDVKFSTLITSAGSLVLGLSWLIGTTAQEILASIIFLFIKHPYDVGDRIKIDDFDMTVKEMNLLYSIFKRVDGTVIQAPHGTLNLKYIHNIRRSGSISENFTFNVYYGTTFDQIEDLRERMLAFLKNEKRDFLAICDVSIVDLPDQEKMTLETTIHYKSNYQNTALHTQRKVKWMVAMKMALAESKIFGPAGDPDAPAEATKYMKVPYEPPAPKEEKEAPPPDSERSQKLRRNASMALNGGRRVLMQQMDAEDEALYHGGNGLSLPRDGTIDSIKMPEPSHNELHKEDEEFFDDSQTTQRDIEAGRVRIQSPEPLQTTNVQQRTQPQQPPHQRQRGEFEMRRI